MRSPLFLLPLLFTCSLLRAQSVFDLLHRSAADEAVAVTLTLPLDSLDAGFRGEQPGTLAFVDSSGAVRTFGTDVSLRGRFRRGRCTTPPLKLNFGKKELRAAGLADHDKYKLVNACFDDSTATDLLLREYLAYRAYALLSPEAHFRAQLLRLTYRDAAGEQSDRTGYAFVLEDSDEMAARAGGVEMEDSVGLDADRFEPVAEATHALLQYLIGNADYSLTLNRNVKLVERPDGSLVPVGYDFDFSGWVGAPYASPSREKGQESIYQRVYLGFGQSDRTLRQVSHEFRRHRRELLGLIGDFDLLPARDRQIITRFVHRFYDDMATMGSNTGILLYDQLRGATASIIPPGGKPHQYRSSSRR